MDGTRIASRRHMALPSTLLRIAAAAALAAVAAGALRAHGRRPGVDEPLAAWLAQRLHDTDAEGHYRYCVAYYASRRFRLRTRRESRRGSDADLYFGTLARPVAAVRILSPSRRPADVSDIQDLGARISRGKIPRAIVHATGGYSRAATDYARDARIRLVGVDDLVRDIAGMTPRARAAFRRALERADAPRPSPDYALE